MKFRDYTITTKQRKLSLTINVKHKEDPFTFDIVIPNSLREDAGDIINAVTKEKEEANG